MTYWTILRRAVSQSTKSDPSPAVEVISGGDADAAWTAEQSLP